MSDKKYRLSERVMDCPFCGQELTLEGDIDLGYQGKCPKCNRGYFAFPWTTQLDIPYNLWWEEEDT